MMKPVRLYRPKTPRAIALTILAGVVALTLGAKINVAMWPVPMTLQSMALVLIGAFAGPRIGGLTLLAYLATGAVGLPVFASGGGLAYLTESTAGYLFAFPVAAVFAGWAINYCARFLSASLIFLIAHAMIFIGGVGWLAQSIGLESAVENGMIPFIPGAIIKSLAAAGIIQIFRPDSTSSFAQTVRHE